MLLSNQPIRHLRIQHRRLDVAVPHDASEGEYILAIEHILHAECVS